jgi:hypothetical protein
MNIMSIHALSKANTAHDCAARTAHHRIELLLVSMGATESKPPMTGRDGPGRFAVVAYVVLPRARDLTGFVRPGSIGRSARWWFRGCRYPGTTTTACMEKMESESLWSVVRLRGTGGRQAESEAGEASERPNE